MIPLMSLCPFPVVAILSIPQLCEPTHRHDNRDELRIRRGLGLVGAAQGVFSANRNATLVQHGKDFGRKAL